MNTLFIFAYEWKHFARSPFKIVAAVLFLAAGIYALHNGAALYRAQSAEIERIKDKTGEQTRETMVYYERGEKGPKERPWVDVTTPFWAIWNTPVYHFKSPSPAMVFSIGQAEQYGFYKRVTFQSSPYDADLAEEIANPERLQSGTLDFSFVTLYLMPLLLLVWLYNLKGAESDQGFLPLILTQTGSSAGWLIARVTFYALGMVLLLFVLMLYGAGLTGVFQSAAAPFWRTFLLLVTYLVIWVAAFTLVIHFGTSSTGNTLKMVGIWLLFVFVIPAAVHLWVNIQHPANLMVDFIDAKREDREKLFNQPDHLIQAQLEDLFPEISDSPLTRDSSERSAAMSRTAVALVNELVKSRIAKIETSNAEKNNLIRSTYWFNPVSLFQNKLNDLTRTDFQDYRSYRSEIQDLIDRQIRFLVLDTWEGREVDQARYLEYGRELAFEDNLHKPEN